MRPHREATKNLTAGVEAAYSPSGTRACARRSFCRTRLDVVRIARQRLLEVDPRLLEGPEKVQGTAEQQKVQ